MKWLRLWVPLCILFMMTLAGTASAVAIDLVLHSSETVGASFPGTSTYTPSLPIAGSGDIDFGAGTGSLSLPNYSIVLDIAPNPEDDAQINVTAWSQTITSIDGSGNITSTGGGFVSCTVLGGIGGFICPGVPSTVNDWPPPGGGSSAVLTELLPTHGLITVIDASGQAAGNGVTTQIFSYTVVPEPGTALLMGGGLIALAMRRHRRES